jgi:hypothetical protein
MLADRTPATARWVTSARVRPGRHGGSGAAQPGRAETRWDGTVYFRLTVWNRVSPSGEISTPAYAVLCTQA